MALIAKNTNDFGRQCLVENLAGEFGIAAIPLGDRAILDMMACPFTDRFDVHEEGDALYLHFVIPHELFVPLWWLRMIVSATIAIMQ
jgi:hypothetical protein